MWIGSDSDLEVLETYVWGYLTALSEHHIDEGVPLPGRDFSTWIRMHNKRWEMACGWARAIKEHLRANEKPLDRFFELLDAYRQLRLVVRSRVTLQPRHLATGKHGRLGPPPQRIEIVQYRPEPLHFLRFHFADRIEDEDALMRPNGSHATTVRFAKGWVQEVFQVELSLWKDAKR